MTKEKVMDNYIPIDPLKYLKEFEYEDVSKEVLCTLGNEEIIKEDGKYYLANTINPRYSKEISRESATEIWQSYNNKKRSDISITFDF